MSGKTKNYYVSIYNNQQKKTEVPTKIFYAVADANQYVKDMKEKYPAPEFTVTREYY